MAIQFQGFSGVLAEIEATWRALRTRAAPLDHTTFGHYRASLIIPLLATQAANGTLMAFRWSDATRLCALTKLRLQLQQTAVATATIMPAFQAVVARSWSVADSAGIAATIDAKLGKVRTSHATSLLGANDLRFSSAAAGLTAGTRTLDATSIIDLTAPQWITPSSATLAAGWPTYEKGIDFRMGDGEHPIIFAQNEGFVVKGPTIVFGAAGTANLIVDWSWAELAAF